MRGLRFKTQSAPAYNVGAEGEQRIAVEKIIALAREIFAAAPVLTTLAVFVDAQQDFSDEIGDALDNMGLVEESLGQMRLDHERWVLRLSHYASWVASAIGGATVFAVDADGNVVSPDSPDVELEMDAADFLDLYVAQPLLRGNAYTIPSAEYDKNKDGEGYAGLPDIGTGFSLVNQINAVGNIFDDASLLEKRFGIWLEIAAQVKQSEWAEPYIDELETVMNLIDKAAGATGDFIEETVKGLKGTIIGLAFAGVIAYALIKGS